MTPSPRDLQAEFDRLGPWTTQFLLGGCKYGGNYVVAEQDTLLRDFMVCSPQAGRVLELDCMEGGRTFPLARRVGHVVAIDVRREHLQRARFVQEQLEVANVTFLEMDLESADLETLGQFDVVHNVGLFYHLADPARLLRQLSRIAPAMFLWTCVAQTDKDECGGYKGAFWNENRSDPVGGVRPRSFRPTQAELVRMLTDCGYRNIQHIRQDGSAVTLWCETNANQAPQRLLSRDPLKVAVIVTCHNYGRYLDECLRSLMHQSRRPDEIILVDDASDDDTAEVAARWADWGVRYLRVDHRNVRLARLAGLESTSSEIVCFLDADDRLMPDYLRSGLAAFDRHDIGFVYSDADRFDEENTFVARPEKVDVASMSRTNLVHNGALVRREALEMSRALEVSADPQVTHEDWLVWRRILEQGWKAKKQRAIYGYRSHEQSVSRSKQVEQSYFELRGLTHETITLFIALSGRMSLWPRMRHFLEEQTWPHDQTRLLLMDTSQNDEFGRQVRHWLAECDYLDVRYLAKSVGNPGLADQNRHQRDVQDHVRLAAARIYNRMAREVTGNFVWILEDDVIPLLDAAEKLLRGFDGETVSVAGPYPSRFHEGYVAWTEGRQIIKSMPKTGDQRSKHTASDRSNSSSSSLRSPAYSRIEGNGFGCVMLRTEVLANVVFTCRQPPHYDFDPAFYERIKDAGLVKVCWDVECEHLRRGIR